MNNRIEGGIDFLQGAGGLFTQKNHYMLYFKKGIVVAIGTLTWAGICQLLEGINNYKF